MRQHHLIEKECTRNSSPLGRRADHMSLLTCNMHGCRCCERIEIVSFVHSCLGIVVTLCTHPSCDTGVRSVRRAQVAPKGGDVNMVCSIFAKACQPLASGLTLTQKSRASELLKDDAGNC